MQDRTIVWIFLAFILGFAMPVCSCVGTGFIALNAMVRMIGGSVPTTTGVGDAVAVIRLDGAISSSSGNSLAVQGITPDLVVDLLEQAAVDPAIKAVVVRVNSPGGTVVASDEIYRAFLEFDKPIVVLMEEMAASGGYYIACGSDHILAHPATLTGSIGVISQFYNVEELLDKVGVDVIVIASGPHKDIGSSFREMTEEEQALWQGIADEIYGDFVALVAQARDLPPEQVRELADGSVYTGRQAFERGLVDGVGTVDDAITKAAELGGIEGEPRVIELESTPSLLDSLYGFQTRSTVPTLEEILGWAGAPSLEFRFVGP